MAVEKPVGGVTVVAARVAVEVVVDVAQSLVDIDWPDVTESTPALTTAIMMPLSFSVADGIGIGFISYVAVKLLAGRHSEVPAAVFLVALVFVGKFAFL